MREQIGKYEVVLSQNNRVLVFVGDALYRDVCRELDDPALARRYFDKLCDALEKEASQ